MRATASVGGNKSVLSMATLLAPTAVVHRIEALDAVGVVGSEQEPLWRRLKRGVYGVLFVMARDAAHRHSRWSYVMLGIQLMQVWLVM
jgi:hypothetical protein